MNCPHSADSWCLDCVIAQHSAFEAELGALRAQNALLENDCNMLSLDRQELRERLAEYEDAPTSSCLWSPDVEFEGDTWDSSCGAKWSFIEGGPFENNVAFCHKCGKPLIVKPTKEGTKS